MERPLQNHGNNVVGALHATPLPQDYELTSQGVPWNTPTVKLRIIVARALNLMTLQIFPVLFGDLEIFVVGFYIGSGTCFNLVAPDLIRALFTTYP